MDNKHVLEFDDSNFDTEVLQSELPVLVDFWASWCAPCRLIAPHVDALAETFAGKVKVGKVNTDDSPKTVQRFNVMSIPALILYKDGQPVDQIVGAVPKENIEQMLQKHA